jgi:hypothetical protein
VKRSPTSPAACLSRIKADAVTRIFLPIPGDFSAPPSLCISLPSPSRTRRVGIELQLLHTHSYEISHSSGIPPHCNSPTRRTRNYTMDAATTPTNEIDALLETYLQNLHTYTTLRSQLSALQTSVFPPPFPLHLQLLTNYLVGIPKHLPRKLPPRRRRTIWGDLL